MSTSNSSLPRLPPTHTISRRPILHPAIADPHAGPSVAKCVYVSRRTPLMGAVKRVKKLLAQIEKRASDRARGERGSTAPSRGRGRGRGSGQPPSVRQVNAVLARDGEQVLVKASGRAMDQALKVAEWFREREKDVFCNVDVRYGNVAVVDDIVEVEGESEGEEDVGKEGEGESSEMLGMDPGETTLELMGDTTVTSVIEETVFTDHNNNDDDDENENENKDQDPTKPPQQQDSSKPIKNTRKRKRRKRPVYDADDIPEARMRWIKTIEVAVSLKT
ncbi:hypothetical protein B0A52_03926 [Exophiala mesophila]|uniref:Uncharacterized protein n=1 Tax=Exophiala mesophila TaxID=212818 RepID=A0A438N7L8_EXOME|nr:hypothetical protein B0A52_03926 [Exophiala mesophila]